MNPEKPSIPMVATGQRHTDPHGHTATQSPKTHTATLGHIHSNTHSHLHPHSHSHPHAALNIAGPTNAALLPLSLSSSSLSGTGKMSSPLIEYTRVLNAIDTDLDKDEFPDTDDVVTSKNESSETGKPNEGSSIRKQVLGVFLVLTVVVIWVLTAELMQFIFEEQDFSKPFFLTYFSNSLLSLFLLRHMKSWREIKDLYDGIRMISILREYKLLPADEKAAEDKHTYGSETEDPDAPYPIHVVASIAIKITPVWFLSIWAYNASLVLTSVASNTILSSTSSLFVLIVGRLIGMETITLMKILSAMTTIAGVGLVSLEDGNGFEGDSFIGDVVSLTSAVIYAVYTLMLKKLLHNEQKASMTLFFGLMGLACTLTMWPLFIVLHFTGMEPFELPPAQILGFLFLNGLIGTLLSEILWLWAILITSPLLASLGLSMSIPVAVVCDFFLHNNVNFSAQYMIGTSLVIAGFFIANINFKNES